MVTGKQRAAWRGVRPGSSRHCCAGSERVSSAGEAGSIVKEAAPAAPAAGAARGRPAGRQGSVGASLGGCSRPWCSDPRREAGARWRLRCAVTRCWWEHRRHRRQHWSAVDLWPAGGAQGRAEVYGGLWPPLGRTKANRPWLAGLAEVCSAAAPSGCKRRRFGGTLRAAAGPVKHTSVSADTASSPWLAPTSPPGLPGASVAAALA